MSSPWTCMGHCQEFWIRNRRVLTSALPQAELMLKKFLTFCSSMWNFVPESRQRVGLDNFEGAS